MHTLKRIEREMRALRRSSGQRPRFARRATRSSGPGRRLRHTHPPAAPGKRCVTAQSVAAHGKCVALPSSPLPPRLARQRRDMGSSHAGTPRRSRATPIRRSRGARRWPRSCWRPTSRGSTISRGPVEGPPPGSPKPSRRPRPGRSTRREPVRVIGLVHAGDGWHPSPGGRSSTKRWVAPVSWWTCPQQKTGGTRLPVDVPPQKDGWHPSPRWTCR